MKATTHWHIIEETRIATMNVGLNATCADCLRIPGDHCRAHFVAEIERLRDALKVAHDHILTIDETATACHEMLMKARALRPTAAKPE